MKKVRGLGRGLDALLGGETSTAATQAGPTSLSIAQLRTGRYQPRTRMNPEALAGLADSIRSQGVVQPILVRPVGDGHYEIIAGERRFRAAQMAGLTEVPVVVRDVPDESALAMALIENIQREDLNPLEEAQGLQRLIREFSFTHEQAAQAIGRSRSATSNLLRLLNLAPPVQEMLMAGNLDMGHARALLAVDGAIQVQLGHQIIVKGLSVREAEVLVARAQQGEGKQQKKAATTSRNRDRERLEEELSDMLGAAVTLRSDSKGRGKVVIAFSGLDQLDGILTRLRR
ncbi:MAG TPA: ParB/RepB/Spo0J family partition protein [Burkholderiaceae bacterium]|nr:ParB/RepB/Spo0J family partition protein [Burkholderiaceae bacterium]